MDNSAITYNRVKEDIENCIISTNNVIERWINVNNVAEHKITNQDVESIFYGYLARALNKYYVGGRSKRRVGKKFSKNLYLALDKNKLVSNVLYDNLEFIYFIDKYIIDHMKMAFDEIDYKYLQTKKLEDVIIETDINIDFSNIENIKF